MNDLLEFFKNLLEFFFGFSFFGLEFFSKCQKKKPGLSNSAILPSRKSAKLNSYLLIGIFISLVIEWFLVGKYFEGGGIPG